jgi:cobalt-zinc-cadmium efflux system outer membrane protein
MKNSVDGKSLTKSVFEIIKGRRMARLGLARRRHLKILYLYLVVLFAAGCVRFQPKPVTAAKVLDDFEARRLDAPEIKDSLLAKQGLKEWPPPSWNLHALTLAAFYYHPDLDVARAQWGVAQAGRITAGERPNPTGSVLAGYNVTTPVSEVTPWIPEAALEIPIETAGKRGYRISQARHLSEAARLNIFTVAWEVRSRLRQAFLDFYAARETESLLNRQQSLQSEIVRILEGQLAVGEASSYDVTQARIALANSRLAAIDAALQRSQARIRLADALGIPVKALEGIVLSFEEFIQVWSDLPSSEIRRRALVNRFDILGALSEYEAAQSALRLEIAKQYPDINLGPAYQLDQTDSKWTLGLSLVLPILSRNKGPIAEAQARREEMAARFLALQARVISEIEAAVSASRSAVDKVKAADDLLTNLKRQQESSKARYELGDISKLELLGVELELASNGLARLDALVKAQRAIGDLENAMESPLDLKEWIVETPGRVSGPAKERRNE